jgi:hypothetical protein
MLDTRFKNRLGTHTVPKYMLLNVRTVWFTSVLQIPPLAVPKPLFMTAPDKESPLVNCLFHPKDKLDVVHVEEGCLHHPCITLLIS